MQQQQAGESCQERMGCRALHGRVQWLEADDPLGPWHVAVLCFPGVLPG